MATISEHRAAERRFKAALLRLFDKNPERMERMINGLIAKAEKGDVNAFRECADRVDGKAEQSIDANVKGTVEVVFKTVYENEPDA